jgi:molybdenum cofactor synthesis domain-containing protein
MNIRGGILTLSDRASVGEYEDRSGPAIREGFTPLPELVIDWCNYEIIPDDRAMIIEKLTAWSDEDKLDMILTTGGTGPAPRDFTPEATREVLDIEIPGIPEAMRAHVRDQVPTAVLTRGLAGVRGCTLIINLPGSPKAVRENIEALLPFIEHLLSTVKGKQGCCGSD